MLSKLLDESHASHDLDLSRMASKTEGFVAADLKAVVARALHVCAARDVSSDGVTEDDFEAALQDFAPSALASVSLHRASELGWEDVGGLSDVRNTLVETLMWPTKVCTLVHVHVSVLT